MKTLKATTIPFAAPAATHEHNPVKAWLSWLRTAMVLKLNHAPARVVMRVWNGGRIETEKGKKPSPRLYINGKIICTSTYQRPRGGDSWNSTT
ncbi:MAG: hypothetical protein Q7P63_02585 [Verrucomicrobiota bacterium JB022]|nr:hypothetical protein [Verrucomicrobiota bacterium JB022]